MRLFATHGIRLWLDDISTNIAIFTVGIEGVDPKKPRIHLKKIAPPPGENETPQLPQGPRGENAEDPAKRITKGKRKLTAEEVTSHEKRKKQTEDRLPMPQSPMDLSTQTKVNPEVSEGNSALISKMEWAEATRPLKILVHIPLTSVLLYDIYS